MFFCFKKLSETSEKPKSTKNLDNIKKVLHFNSIIKGQLKDL